MINLLYCNFDTLKISFVTNMFYEVLKRLSFDKHAINDLRDYLVLFDLSWHGEEEAKEVMITGQKPKVATHLPSE